MQITILGGGGFLGRKLAIRLARDGALGDQAITGLTLFDLQAPAGLEAPSPSPASAATWPMRPRWPAPSRRGPAWWSTSPPWSRPRRRRISTSASAST
ncbi:hypothetical protein ACFQY5_29740 [Paeniroseomonas aquatica]|uniref:hypothetical protein n=1 Tax=Paeniroseomonas aquatica TaxID=373043 RepID=UPI00360ED449